MQEASDQLTVCCLPIRKDMDSFCTFVPALFSPQLLWSCTKSEGNAIRVAGVVIVRTTVGVDIAEIVGVAHIR